MNSLVQTKRAITKQMFAQTIYDSVTLFGSEGVRRNQDSIWDGEPV